MASKQLLITTPITPMAILITLSYSNVSQKKPREISYKSVSAMTSEKRPTKWVIWTPEREKFKS